MRKLGLYLLLLLCLIAPSLSEQLTEVERLSQIFADGGRVTRDFKPPMSWLERCPQPGAMICPDGLIVSLRNGYLMTSWDSVQSVAHLPDAVVITLGHPELSGIGLGWEPDRAVLELHLEGEDGVIRLPEEGGPEIEGADGQALRKALEGYLEIDDEGKVIVRPEAERQHKFEFGYRSSQRYR